MTCKCVCIPSSFGGLKTNARANKTLCIRVMFCLEMRHTYLVSVLHCFIHLKFSRFACFNVKNSFDDLINFVLPEEWLICS